MRKRVQWLGLDPDRLWYDKRPCAVFKDDDRTVRYCEWFMEKANGFYGWEEPVRAVEQRAGCAVRQ